MNREYYALILGCTAVVTLAIALNIESSNRNYASVITAVESMKSVKHLKPLTTISVPTITKTEPTKTTLSLLSSIFGIGSNNKSDVLTLQTFLSQHGYLDSKDVVGIFGPKTVEAVKKFQNDNNLPMTGFVGTLTREKINFLISQNQ